MKILLNDHSWCENSLSPFVVWIGTPKNLFIHPQTIQSLCLFNKNHIHKEVIQKKWNCLEMPFYRTLVKQKPKTLS